MRLETLDDMLNAYMRFFRRYEMTEENIRRVYKNYQLTKPLGSVHDFLWYLLNFMLSENTRQTSNLQKFHSYQMEILLEMLSFVRIYEGRTGNDILQDVERNRVEGYRYLPHAVMVKISGKGCCSYCDTLHDKQYEIEDYLLEMPLGSQHCTRKTGCSCRSVAVPKISTGDWLQKQL